mgnify:CR=1 FL=1
MMKTIGGTLLFTVCVLLVVAIPTIVGLRFGALYGFILFLIIAAIYGLVLIKSDDKTEDKL